MQNDPMQKAQNRAISWADVGAGGGAAHAMGATARCCLSGCARRGAKRWLASLGGEFTGP